MTTDHRTTGHLTMVRHHLAALQVPALTAMDLQAVQVPMDLQAVQVPMDLQAVREDQGITATGVEVDRVVAAKC
ncbi:hypothetical protein EV2_026720 [Malus domestica]